MDCRLPYALSLAMLILFLTPLSTICQVTNPPAPAKKLIGPENMAETSSIAQSQVTNPDTSVKHLWQPYYIYPRTAGQHISLEGNWQLAYLDAPFKSPGQLPESKAWMTVKNNSTVHTTLFQSGRLPDPYQKMNAELYRWVEQKAWYYKKSFTLPAGVKGNYVFLSFDGIDYFARIWLNGKMLGRHEGMFGGPSIEVSKLISFGETNEVLVEVLSANYGMTTKFNPKAPGRVIKGWAFTGGTGVEPFFTVGMWRGARIDIVPSIHVERPFIVTKKASAKEAVLTISTELFVRKQSLEFQLHPWGNAILSRGVPSTKLLPAPEKLQLRVRLTNAAGMTQIKNFPIAAFEGRNWLSHDITVPDPDLWWPNGMGKPNLYKLALSVVQNGKEVDQINLEYGIRTIETLPNAGPRVEERWKNWHFAVNGRPIFLKGINWMPMDVLLNLPVEKYRWLLGMAKDAGVQMIRIWGSGLMETEEFYDICSELGIMVWQDFPISHYDAPDYPADVWEAQVLQNVFRLRNHASLAVYNGGNGHNPYSHGNNRTLGILERILADYDPTRVFSRTTSDAGNAHLYPDLDPAFFAALYRYVPLVSEAGMHSIGDPTGLKEVISPKELMDLGNIYSEEFAASHKEFIAHFAEFEPSRVPRMLSRASHIDNMAAPTIESIAEATQVGAGEFYQLVSDGLQGNYPFNNGLMPWVFNRTWPVVSAIMIVDGFGQPSAPYYFLKRTYESTHVKLDLSRLLWAPGEVIPLNVRVINSLAGSMPAKVSISIYDDAFKKMLQKEGTIAIKPGTSVSALALGNFTIPSGYQDRYFFTVVQLTDTQGRMISRSVYWPRSLSLMLDTAYRNRQISLDIPQPWPTFTKGPWLKPTTALSKTALTAEISGISNPDSDRSVITLKVVNAGKNPAFMTQVNINGAKRVFYSNDNFFWMAPGESKTLDVQVYWREALLNKEVNITVSSWNAAEQVIKLPNSKLNF